MKYLKLLIANIILVCTQLSAQVSNQICIEIDPTAFVLKGYSVHGIYQVAKLSFDFGIWKVEEPEWIAGNNGFKDRVNGLGIMVSYHFNGLKGWFCVSSTYWVAPMPTNGP